MLTEWNLGLERISIKYSSRLDAIETTQADVNTRLRLLEERALSVELRVPPQPPRQ